MQLNQQYNLPYRVDILNRVVYSYPVIPTDFGKIVKILELHIKVLASAYDKILLQLQEQENRYSQYKKIYKYFDDVSKKDLSNFEGMKKALIKIFKYCVIHKKKIKTNNIYMVGLNKIIEKFIQER